MSFLQVINPFGLLFAALLLLPHILFRGLRTVTKENVPNLGMYWLDRLGRFGSLFLMSVHTGVGRFGSLFLMSVHTGVLEKGFTDPKELMQRFWLITTAVLVLAYWLLWVLFCKRNKKAAAYGIVAASAAAVILSGILQVNTLLFTAGVVYLIGELYIVRHRNPEASP